MRHHPLTENNENFLLGYCIIADVLTYKQWVWMRALGEEGGSSSVYVIGRDKKCN